AYVRSGPGKQFYPTAQLKRGERVTVHRHDPGGWYMIAPPAGSFSWIRAEYITKTSADRGLITENNVIVRVGSTFGDDTRQVEQVRLAKNDQVQILEEKTLTTANGPVRHYKISPPTGEYRWVSGKYVTPVDQIVKNQQDQNPFAIPSTAKQSLPTEATNTTAQKQTGTAPNVFESPQKKSPNDVAIRRRGPDPTVLTAQRQQLEVLDTQFREMVNGRTSDWNFTSLEQGYQQLQQQAALPALAHQIDLRFAAIGRYRKIKTEYDDLIKLTTETRQRDAQLMSIQREQVQPTPPNSPSPAENEPLVPIPDPFATTPAQVPEPVELPGLEIPTQTPVPPVAPPSQSQPTPPSTPPQNSRSIPRFDGAGIVQRAAAAGTGTPAYVLITPQGRVLAYLQPVQGLNLEPYVGKAMGIYGQRGYRQDLRVDQIIVRSLTPVRLAP
ncbi:MAG: hypothetical protein KDA84_05300, partial [Planctomycetaceae bacterium]|nr:hypothetical protein [Planctomycetaceae bacterium]